MSYLENLKTEANYTRTLNGALTHGSTSDACLDFFAVAGGMRYRKRNDQINLFDRAYIETPELAAKLLFHLRDIRGGMGERAMFRTLLRHVAFAWPETAKKNAKYIAEFGRWDDLMCLLGTPAEEEAVRVIRGVRDRYDGKKRNPYNEMECGNNYARSMAAFSFPYAMFSKIVPWNTHVSCSTIA